jgi:ABC-type Zn2+ transport system substrate-binding protein/surface adhesin
MHCLNTINGRSLIDLFWKTPKHLEAALVTTQEVTHAHAHAHAHDNDNDIDNNHNHNRAMPSPALPSLLLHTMCWKASPSLALKLLQIIGWGA